MFSSSQDQTKLNQSEQEVIKNFDPYGSIKVNKKENRTNTTCVGTTNSSRSSGSSSVSSYDTSSAYIATSSYDSGSSYSSCDSGSSSSYSSCD